MAAKKQDGFKLISLFVGLYEKKYGHKPKGLNRYRDAHGFMAMIDDLGQQEAEGVVRYYIERTEKPGHPISFLLFNYDKLWQSIEEQVAEEERREELRRETQRRMEELDERNG